MLIREFRIIFGGRTTLPAPGIRYMPLIARAIVRGDGNLSKKNAYNPE